MGSSFLKLNKLQKLLRQKAFKRLGYLDRQINTQALRLLKLSKRFPYLVEKLPSKLQYISENWTGEMVDQYISTKGMTFYHDIPAELNIPTNPKPKITTKKEFRLTPQEISSFYENGFIGPFDALCPDEVKAIKKSVKSNLKVDHPHYGFPTPRDLHFSDDKIMSLFRKASIVERCAQILGPNLLTWRTQVFDKQPNTAPIPWHQAVSYLFEDIQRPIVSPPSYSELFQLTVWVALDNTTENNGCIRFIPGTHKKIRPLVIDTQAKGNSTFWSVPPYSLQGIAEIDHEAVEVKVRAGQFLIFSERVIHGSKPNRTSKPRLAINMRVITPDCKVYSGKIEQLSVIYGEDIYNLKKWGNVVLRGEDKFAYSPIYKESVDL